MRGKLDDTSRVLRISIGLFMVLFGLLLGEWWELLGSILGALGLILFVLGIAGWSPTYALLGKKTQQSTEQEEKTK